MLNRFTQYGKEGILSCQHMVTPLVSDVRSQGYSNYNEVQAVTVVGAESATNSSKLV
jgi:hypothetical protein